MVRGWGHRSQSFAGSWKLGPCSSNHTYYHTKGSSWQTEYTERCCLTPGKHILACTGNPADVYDIKAWNAVNGGFLEIQGHKYCDDAIFYNSMQIIHIVGTDGLINYMM